MEYQQSQIQYLSDTLIKDQKRNNFVYGSQLLEDEDNLKKIALQIDDHNGKVKRIKYDSCR